MKLSLVLISLSLIFIFSSCGTDGDGPKTLVVVWLSNDDLGATVGPDADIFVSRSTDNGVSWNAVQTLNSNAHTDTGDDYLIEL